MKIEFFMKEENFSFYREQKFKKLTDR